MDDDSKKSKLRNKKKDIITADVEKATIIEKKEDNEEKKNDIKEDIKKNMDSIDTNILNKIIFNIQLLLSLHNQIDERLYNIVINYLSSNNLKEILEERDCGGVCGNMLCGKKLLKEKNNKFYFNSKTKDFVKDDIEDFFCDVRCLQKFKDVLKISNKFDYFSLARLEALFYLSFLTEYYPDNKYISNISKFSKVIYEKKIKDGNHNKDIDRLEKSFRNYFEAIEEIKYEENCNTENLYIL